LRKQVGVAYTTDMSIDVANATDSYADRVADRAEGLAPAERHVALSLADLGPEAALLSAVALAQALGTSDATVVRTAKSLGYSGLGDLRRALTVQSENPPLGERLRRTLEQTPDSDPLGSAVRNHLSELDSLGRNVSPAAFLGAVALLANSKRIVWRGVGPSAALASYGELISQRIGKPSTAFVHSGTSFADELLTLQSNDCIVLFAYGRLQRHVEVLLQQAVSLEVPTVLITDVLARRLERSVDVVLRCGRGIPGLFASHATTLVVVEALVLAVAATNRSEAETSLTRLNELRASLGRRRR
jgi:DNA-binding MurR/RpiR family transcriptional regulator